MKWTEFELELKIPKFEKLNSKFLEITNKLPLTVAKKNEDLIWVNLLEYAIISPEGVLSYYNTWITNYLLENQNVREIAKGGRARFTIENKSFNEQKNLGFQTEHNFGHQGNLPSVFFGLAQIAHLLSQVFGLWTRGKLLISEIGSHRRFWERLATVFSSVELPDNRRPILYLKLIYDSS